jgi:hypothetical protein
MLGSFPRRSCGHGGALLLSSTTTAAAAVRKSIPLRNPLLSQQRRFILQAPLSAQQEEEIARHRHHGIIMHPDSISHLILPPGNVVRRTTRRGTLQNQYVDLEYGHFWMLKDLQRSQEKPILSNETLIPQRMAKPFPILTKCKSLTGENIDLSVDYFTRKNRSGDAAAQCTLVAISFRDYGFRQLSTVRFVVFDFAAGPIHISSAYDWLVGCCCVVFFTTAISVAAKLASLTQQKYPSTHNMTLHDAVD